MPSEVAKQGYLSADLVVIAFAKAGKELTMDSFVKALESIQGYQHPFGGLVINFGPEKHLGSNESILLQIQNGKWVSPPGQKKVLGH